MTAAAGVSRERWAHTSNLMALTHNVFTVAGGKSADDFNPYKKRSAAGPEHHLEKREFVEILAVQWGAKKVS